MTEALRIWPIRVAMVCHELGTGGAARATERIARAVQDSAAGAVEIRMFVATPKARFGLAEEGFPGSASRIRRAVSMGISRTLDVLPSTTENTIIHSRADIWTGLGAAIRRWCPDVVHFHWLGSRTISIKEIAGLPYPKVWTLHDMWAFLGAEHVSYDERFIYGYRWKNRPSSDSGIDWSRHTWRRKRKHWGDPMHAVAPSTWMRDQAQASVIMSQWTTTTIPNPIATDIWHPQSKSEARRVLGLPDHEPLLLASALGGLGQNVKGGDLLHSALKEVIPPLTRNGQKLGILVIGAKDSRPTGFEDLPIQVFNLGRVHDDSVLRNAYSAADVTLVPSRAESFSQVAAESLACGTPVVAFAVGGLLDVIDDRVTGRLVTPFNTSEFAASVCQVVEDVRRGNTLGRNGPHAVRKRYSNEVVSAAYLRVYRQAIESSRPSNC